MAEGFCVKCGAVIESFDGLTCCPVCKTSSLPCLSTDQVNVNINVHELRILCIWAEQWVNAMRDEQTQAESAEALRSIVERLTKQLPKDTYLLICDELRALKDHDLEVDSSFIDI